MALRLSVALATYNGERFLSEQLESFASQHRPPDELVVCDDASADATATIVRHFASKAPFEVRLAVNAERLGCADNFARAISLCSGDVIFPSDQDDVWLEDKLETIERVMQDHPEVGMVFGDMHVVDDDLRPLGYTSFDALGFRAAPRRLIERGRTFETLLRFNVVSGTAMGFRAPLRDVVVPVGSGWVHDEWIALIVSALSECVAIDRPFVMYRQHERQQIGLKRLGVIGQVRRAWAMGEPYMRRMVARSEAARSRLLGCGLALLRPEYAALLDAKLHHARLRLSLRGRTLRLPKVLRALGRGDYERFDYGWKSAVQDLVMP